MAIQIRPVSYAIGAEVTGVDLSKPLNEKQWVEIRAAWLQHLLLVFPGQQLTPEQQITFASYFGVPDDHSEDPYYFLPGYPHIYQVGNFTLNGKMSKSKDAGRKWHSDYAFTTRPSVMGMMYCRKIPPVGGTTIFANMYTAYETLSDTLKGILQKMEAVHDILNYFPLAKDTAGMREKLPPVVHPVISVHPDTGRKALYVTKGYTSRFAGMTKAESQGLLQYLFSHSTRPEFTYRHTYSVDDLIVWDNRCTQHMAPGDYVHDVEHPRHLYLMQTRAEKSGRLCITGE